MENKVEPAQGRLGVLVVGLGAVATTFIAGTLAIRKGMAKPIGSITQMAKIRLGKKEENRNPLIKDVVPLTDLNDLVFGSWDIFPDSAYESATHAQVLKQSDIDRVKDELDAIKPMPAAFDNNWVKRLHGTHIKNCKSRWDMVEQLRADIRNFKAANKCDRVVVIWAASTEIYLPYCPETHDTLAHLEQAMKDDKQDKVSPSMCYAYAALSEGAPFIMGAPNTCVDVPAMWEMAEKTKMPICGKDYKTGQTLMKTVLSPMLHTRMLGLNGWFSTNILGNRDGEVLDDPSSFKTKEVSKLSVLDSVLEPKEYPDLYSNYYHKVRINYYPPRNDNKEGWDNIDIFGWLGYPMQIKIDFLCRDSILAAPLLLDLVLFTDLAARNGMYGTQRWLSFFFKSPMHDYTVDEDPVNDLFIQWGNLKNKLRDLIGEKHLDYAD
jgi:myo-inositol-1-phosphate synthase